MLAIGALAIGALAIGTLAIGTLAIGRVAVAHAQPVPPSAPPALEVVLEPAPHLVVGDHAEVVARVRLGGGAGRPLLVTPSVEGGAVEVVRGRLMHGDAEDPAARELRFRIPIVARTVGMAVLRVRVDGFSCRDGRCSALSVEASVALEVRAVADPSREPGTRPPGLRDDAAVRR
jgi:hypothetical protein